IELKRGASEDEIKAALLDDMRAKGRPAKTADAPKKAVPKKTPSKKAPAKKTPAKKAPGQALTAEEADRLLDELSADPERSFDRLSGLSASQLREFARHVGITSPLSGTKRSEDHTSELQSR